MRPSPIIPSCIADSFEAPIARQARFRVHVVEGCTQAVHRDGHAVAVAEDCRARHQHGGAGPNDQGRCRRVDAPIHFQLAPGPVPLDQLTHPSDLRHGRPEKLLMTEPRVDGHDEHLVHIVDDFLQHDRRRRRVDGDPGALAQCPDPLHRAVQIAVALPVDEKRVGASRGKLVEKEVRVRDHQMRFEGQMRHSPKRLDDRGAHGEIRHEVSIHHIDVDPIRPGPLGLDHLITQAGEVSGEK